jgi:hypothetical protein
MHVRSSLLVAVLAALVAACSSSSPVSTAPPVASTGVGPRPSSNASLTIVSPTDGQAVTGPTVHIVIGLTGATIVAATTTAIRPDEGHIHLYIDGNLVSMNYGSTLDQAVPAGTHVVRAEFVAADHVPFNPRVVTPDVVFTVTP